MGFLDPLDVTVEQHILTMVHNDIDDLRRDNNDVMHKHKLAFALP